MRNGLLRIFYSEIGSSPSDLSNVSSSRSSYDEVTRTHHCLDLKAYATWTRTNTRSGHRVRWWWWSRSTTATSARLPGLSELRSSPYPMTRPASIVIHVEDLLRRHDARVAVVVRTIVSLARLPRRRHNVRAAVRRHRDSTTLSLAMFTTGDDANPPTANRIACLLVGILIPLLLITGGLPALKDLVVLVGLSIAIVVGLCVVGLAMEFEQRYPILLTERYERHGERKARKG